ncbi:uncharacterized protein LOC144884194 [Branchiostoma floridae x Branchiostoma japonicum]
MANLEMEAAIQMDADACVVVSGISDRVNSQKLRECLESGNSDSSINQLVMFPAMGTALFEFLTPEGGGGRYIIRNWRSFATELQVRGLRSVIPPDGNGATLERWKGLAGLLTFLQSLSCPCGHFQQGRQSGASQGAKETIYFADLDMDPDACVVVSGFPFDVFYIDVAMLIRHVECIRQAVVFPAAGTVLMECVRPEWAAIFLANKHRLLKETRLQVKQLETMLSPNKETMLPPNKETMSTLQKEHVQQLAMLKQQLETTKQTLVNRQQQLQHVEAEMEQLKTAYKCQEQAKRNAIVLCRRLEEGNAHLKCQREADKRENARLKEVTVHLKNQREADMREIGRLKKQISSANNRGYKYDMSRAPRGVAIIINNIHFEDMAYRNGAEGDTYRLREAFESLGFTTLVNQDLDNFGMWTVMKNQGKADHSNYDCFVCVIMSHGTMGKVYSSDDVGIDICELMKPVNAKKCPSLKGKPKLFFIQACQGEKTQRKEGFDHGEYDAKPVPFICHEADFFLGLATVPGYVARRDQDGAPYVHHLVKLLKDFGSTHDLSTIMAMVCDKMNDINDDKCGWISSNHSTLRKKVVFNTK